MKKFNVIILLTVIIFTSSCSEDNNVSVPQSEIPSKPKNLTSLYYDSIIQLNWETPEYKGNPEIINYNIFRKYGSSDYENIGSTVYNNTFFIDSSAVLFTEYFYYVSAINEKGESERSNEITASAHPIALTIRYSELQQAIIIFISEVFLFLPEE